MGLSASAGVSVLSVEHQGLLRTVGPVAEVAAVSLPARVGVLVLPAVALVQEGLGAEAAAVAIHGRERRRGGGGGGGSILCCVAGGTFVAATLGSIKIRLKQICFFGGAVPLVVEPPHVDGEVLLD